MLTETEPSKYQVIINGVPFGSPQPTRHLAESLLNNLTVDQRALAEIRPVTQDGRQVLFG